MFELLRYSLRCNLARGHELSTQQTLRQLLQQRMPKIMLFALLLFMFPVVSLAAKSNEKLVERQSVRDFIAEMVKKYEFNSTELTALLSTAELKPKIIDAMNRPAEKTLPWYKYRKIFIKPARIKGGVKFWNEHQETLSRAEKKFGVPAEFIVAIIGVETKYGKHKGGYKVLDSLMTLAFDYPKRSKFFKKELEHFLLLTREEGLDPQSIKGSYAGAMGKPQFISSSYRHYAVDFDGDGVRDLLTNSADTIGSVANYFSEHKWQPGQPVVAKAKVKGGKYKPLLKKGLKPVTAIADFPRYNVSYVDELSVSAKGALVELEQKTGNEYWVGLKNFYVITRYNRSPLYAMAVYQLSQKIRELRHAEMAENKS